MNFFKAFDKEKKPPGLKRLPDGRWQMVRTITLSDGTEVKPLTDAKPTFPPNGTQFSYTATAAELKLVTDAGLDPTKFYLMEAGSGGEKAEAWLTYVWEQLDRNNETQVGGYKIETDDNGRRTLTNNTMQFSDKTFVPGEIGTVVTVEGISFALDLISADGNGTIRAIKRTYLDATSTLTQIGKFTEISASEKRGGFARYIDSGLTVLKGQFIILASASYTSGVKGTTLLPTVTVTGTAATDLINWTAHGRVAGNAVSFTSIAGGAGLAAATTYYVIADGLTANAFKLSATVGGAAIDFTTDITAGVLGSLDYVMADETNKANAAIRVVERVFVQVSDTLYEIGNPDYTHDQNDKKIIKRVWVRKAKSTEPTEVVGKVGVETFDGCVCSIADAQQSACICRIDKTYIEAGLLSTHQQKMGAGITQVTWMSVGTRLNPPGSVVGISVEHPGGLSVFTVHALQNSDGGALTEDDGAAKLALSYDHLVHFEMPGTMDIQAYTFSSTFAGGGPDGPDGRGIKFVQTPRATFKVKARVHVFYQVPDTIEDADKVYDSALGLWNPSTWPTIAYAYTPLNSEAQLMNSEGYAGYRMATLSESPKTLTAQVQVLMLAFTRPVVMGHVCTGGPSFPPVHSVTLSGGPDDPMGKKYVLEAELEPAVFELADGTKVNKKTIVVATIVPA